MNQYETVFILTPVLSDDQMKEAVNKFRGILTDNGAEIINEENWGLKKLAYAIEKKSTGFYILMEFKAQPEVIKTLEVNFRRDEKVLRFLTIKMSPSFGTSSICNRYDEIIIRRSKHGNYIERRYYRLGLQE